MAEAFRQLLKELVIERSMDFEWLGQGKFMAYEDMAQFHAAVFLPEQPDKLTPLEDTHKGAILKYIYIYVYTVYDIEYTR